MKFVCLVIVSVCLGCSYFVDAKDVWQNCKVNRKTPPKFILVKDNNNKPHLLNTQRGALNDFVDWHTPQNVREKDVDFYYISSINNLIKINHEDKALIKDIKRSDFDPKKQTMFIIHGFRSSKNSNVNTLISKALLTIKGWNVFVVDWSRIAYTINYFAAAAAIPEVGEIVANFIQKVKKYFGLDMEKLHVCGHSLGAHVAGRVGEKLQGEVKSIIGMDPAYPGIHYHNHSRRIDSSDAQYVEIIHTNGERNSVGLGYFEPLGHSDFYPNGGSSQKGCYVNRRERLQLPNWLNISKDVIRQSINLSEKYKGFALECSHSRAYEYFAESIYNNTKKFIAKKCKSYKDFKNGLCKQNEKGIMGGTDLDKNLKGTYYLDTASSEPFALGEMGYKRYNKKKGPY